ncbi:TPA: hypothetical protein ACP3ZG_001566 [Pseudomonas aeruginosa]|nr:MULTISPECIES: hypothetical protein [Pseudomonas]ELG7182074.1 hypothetical protein [Pseudomonas aeruginosa]MBH4094931.1 hypothetical protein [Pseudomonas aeruginosa]MBI6604928.1 hypothetical protein [Pseudomonas sp. S4_EA_1b]MBI8852546.1 hypothetical protein [Pseudomonas aeruginosa]OBY57622.1 hypothetical protein A9513_003075 [Pseudomonas sp. AU12215]
MADSKLALRMGQAGFSDTIIRIQTGISVGPAAAVHLARKASVTQLVPALPSFDSIVFESTQAQAAIGLVMNYLEHWDSADFEVGVDALITAHSQSVSEQNEFPLTLEEAWVIARECRCLGSAEVLNLLFSRLNQDC